MLRSSLSYYLLFYVSDYSFAREVYLGDRGDLLAEVTTVTDILVPRNVVTSLFDFTKENSYGFI